MSSSKRSYQLFDELKERLLEALDIAKMCEAFKKERSRWLGVRISMAEEPYEAVRNAVDGEVSPEAKGAFRSHDEALRAFDHMALEASLIAATAVLEPLVKLMDGFQRGLRTELAERDDRIAELESHLGFSMTEIAETEKTPTYVDVVIPSEGRMMMGGSLPAPHVTLEHIESLIVCEHFILTAEALEALGHPVSDALKTHTICILVLKNGFTVIGESACVSRAVFDLDRGREIARKNAVDKIWALEGYLLKTRLHEAQKGSSG